MRKQFSQLGRRVSAAVLGVAVALALPAALSACNTVEGVGEDVSATGQALEEVAEDNP